MASRLADSPGKQCNVCTAPGVMFDAFHQVFSRLKSLKINGSYPPLVTCPTMPDSDVARMTISSSDVLASPWMGQWEVGASFVEMVIDGPLQMS